MIFRDISWTNCCKLHTERICGIEVFPFGHGGWKRARVGGVTQQIPTSDSLRLVLSQRLAHGGGFLTPSLSEREETPL